ncbi:MAG TPA: LysR family transcriptional regulator [Vicinamibacterales bacterium]
MELSQLRAFRTVAETLSFTRAAERLNLTQSAVSRQIGALEAELGEPLFVRGRRVVRLTAFGERTLGQVLRILDEIEALRERSGDPSAPLSGHVHAAAATQAFVYLFASLFESFMRAHPAVILSFRTTASTDQTIVDILDGAVDVGFASRPVFAPSLQVTPLFEDRLVLVTNRDHPLAGRERAAAEDMAHERFILFERGASIRAATDAFFAGAGLTPPTVLESNDTFFIKLMVRQGMGVSLLPAWAVREEVEAGTLARVLVDSDALRRVVQLVTTGRALSSAARAFVDFTIAQRDELQALARAGVG